jgi:hypothetical protein
MDVDEEGGEGEHALVPPGAGLAICVPGCTDGCVIDLETEEEEEEEEEEDVDEVSTTRGTC